MGLRVSGTSRIHQKDGKPLILEATYLKLVIRWDPTWVRIYEYRRCLPFRGSQNINLRMFAFSISSFCMHSCSHDGLSVFRRMRNYASFETCACISSVSLQYGIRQFREVGCLHTIFRDVKTRGQTGGRKPNLNLKWFYLSVKCACP